MQTNSPLSHLRSCVDAYKAGNWHGPGEELEQVLALLEEAEDIISKFNAMEPMQSSYGWLKDYTALKGDR